MHLLLSLPSILIGFSLITACNKNRDAETVHDNQFLQNTPEAQIAKENTDTLDIDKLLYGAISKSLLNFTSKSNVPVLQAIKITSKDVAEICNIEKFECDVPVYIFESKGFNPGEVYDLYNVNMCFGKAYLSEYVVDQEGKLLSKENSKKLNNNCLYMGGFMNGEHTTYALVSPIKQTCVVSVVTPNPIEFNWDNGAYCALYMTSPDACNYLLSRHGFKPREEITVFSRSGTERLKFNLSASEEGTILANINPSILGKKGGNALLKINRPKSEQIASLKYLWGLKAKKQAQFKQEDHISKSS